MKKTYVIAAGAGAVLLAVALGWWWSQRGAAADVQYRTGKVERGPLQSAVSASGAVSPVTQVTVGTQSPDRSRTCTWTTTRRSRRGS